MTNLRGYFDDSGNPNDPQHSCVTIAGYVTTDDGWKWFDRHWVQMIKRHGVPYLHMRELAKKNGVYGHLKDTANADFLSDCVKAIQIAAEFTTSATIRLADLRTFNTETRLNLNPLALAIYGCIIEIRRKYAIQPIDITLDKISKATSVIDAALMYARTDTYANLNADALRIAPVRDESSFRNTPGLQAADFTAWEIRRHCEERKTWNPTESERADSARMRVSFEAWRIRFLREFCRLPRDRMSARMLSAWPPPSGHLWDYTVIKAAHTNRHQNGWVA